MGFYKTPAHYIGIFQGGFFAARFQLVKAALVGSITIETVTRWPY